MKKTRHPRTWAEILDTVARDALAVSICAFSMACGSIDEGRSGQQNDQTQVTEEIETTVQAQMAVGDRPGSVSDVRRRYQHRLAKRESYLNLKSGFDALVQRDPDNRQIAIAEIRAAREVALEVPGSLGAQPGSDASSIPPLDRSRYEALLPKMKDFDMKDPTQAAMWTQLKRQELGR